MGLLWGMMVAPEYGGTFSDYVSFGLAVEEVAACCGGTSVLIQVHNAVGCLPIATFGTESQKRAFLPAPRVGPQDRRVLHYRSAGRLGGATNLRTRAKMRDAKRALNGEKMFVCNGWCAAPRSCSRLPTPDRGKKGISAFIVPADVPGFVKQPAEHKLGMRASDTCAIHFDQCAIPSENLLGERGQGLAIALGNLGSSRTAIAAQATGIACAALDVP